MSTTPAEPSRAVEQSAPPPEDSSKPDSPAALTAPAWRHVVRSTIREFSADGCVDIAAGLTYRTVFSLFPGLIALVSILALFGQSGQTVSAVLDEAQAAVPEETWSTVRPAIESLLTAPAPGLGLIIGLLVALWSASGYVRAFSRAMNTIYGVEEGRGFIRLTAQMYLLTALLLVLGAVTLMIVVLSGPVAQWVGDLLGVGAVAITVWSVAKWLLLAFIIVFALALLYYATPNIEQPRFRWVSIGAFIAIIVAVLATLGFFLYVSNFGSYNATYGALAGVIILLLWIYIINAILLVGAELDAEIERSRELQAGIAAEESIQLPPRSTAASAKKAEKHAQHVGRGRILRLSRGSTDTTD